MVLSKRLLTFLFISLIGYSALAEEMQFSEEELPTEAVTPKLDTPRAVLNRKLTYRNRVQADLGFGWLLDEAFYNNQFIAVQGAYALDEASGIGFRYLSFGSGLSDYGKQFSTPTATITDPPQFVNVGPKSGYMLHYERRMMYGKLSLGKHRVIPALITWNVEGGMISYGSKTLPLLGASVGNRFFVTKNLGLSFGLHGFLRQLVDPISKNLRLGPVNASDLKTTTKISTMLDFNISYLF